MTQPPLALDPQTLPLLESQPHEHHGILCWLPEHLEPAPVQPWQRDQRYWDALEAHKGWVPG